MLAKLELIDYARKGFEIVDRMTQCRGKNLVPVVVYGYFG